MAPTSSHASTVSAGDNPLAPFDGILLVSFGGPEHPDEVMPFLRRVTAGRGVPEERLMAVAEHYERFGGRSPINDETRALLQALRGELDSRGACGVPILWGNRNSEPFLSTALDEAHSRGLSRILGVTTSAYPSYSGCRQYRENVAQAAAEAGTTELGVTIEMLTPYGQVPGFRAAYSQLLAEGLANWSGGERPYVLGVTHSIPTAMAEASGPADAGGAYPRWHEDLLAQLVEDQQDGHPGLAGELVYCSRSGSPRTPWLEPDVNDRIRELANEGVTGVVVIPIGFTADHMEVVNDLDVEAAETAAEVGMMFARVPTVRTNPLFVSALADALFDRAAGERHSTGERRPTPQGWCARGCCSRADAPDLPAIEEPA